MVFIFFNLTILAIHLYAVITVQTLPFGHCYAAEGMSFPIFDRIPDA